MTGICNLKLSNLLTHLRNHVANQCSVLKLLVDGHSHILRRYGDAA